MIFILVCFLKVICNAIKNSNLTSLPFLISDYRIHLSEQKQCTLPFQSGWVQTAAEYLAWRNSCHLYWFVGKTRDFKWATVPVFWQRGAYAVIIHLFRVQSLSEALSAQLVKGALFFCIFFTYWDRIVSDAKRWVLDVFVWINPRAFVPMSQYV